MGQATLRIVMLALAATVLLLATGCNKTARGLMHEAEFAMMAQDYSKALELYEQVLESQPESNMARYGKANALFGLERWEEALALYEEFLTATQSEPSTYKDERFTAEFRRDRCKLELGQEVQQDPNEIPPPPMGE